MKGIKGLIIKDLLQLKSYKKTLIIFITIFILTSITQESESAIAGMLVIMLTLGFGMFSMATFNYDEMSKADRYILTFPLTKKDVVKARYILVIVATIIGSIVGIAISMVILLIMNQSIPNLLDLISIGLGGILAIGIVEAIQIPCVYKLGAEKGRIQMFIITVAVALLLGGIFYIGENANLPIYHMFNVLNQFFPLIIIMAIIMVYGISYKITYQIYLKKEV